MGQPKGSIQPKQKRIKNFQEVDLGYPKRVALEESRRCPQCADPVCVTACPLGIDIPGFIRLLREGNVSGAYEIIQQRNSLPSICGRVCSAPCEVACILTEEDAPIGIRALERYATDNGRAKSSKKDPIERRGKRVAVIGSGPAGLSTATELAQLGYQVAVFESMDQLGGVFESMDQLGGVLRYGIPEYRIPEKVLDADIEEIRLLGVKFKTNCAIGRTVTIAELKLDGFSAFVVATGAGVPKFMDLPGSELGGVYYGEEFLMRVNQRKGNVTPEALPIGNKVVVVGSGNTALDCARAAVRLGRDVRVVFRRTVDEMRVRSSESQYAKEEGVVFEPLVKPVEILATDDNFVSGVKCVRLDYADEDSTGTWSLIPVPSSEFVIEADTVVLAVGHLPNNSLGRTHKRLKTNSDGTLQINNETGMTTIKGIFAAGNIITNAGPVVEAIASGKLAADDVHEFLTGK